MVYVITIQTMIVLPTAQVFGGTAQGDLCGICDDDPAMTANVTKKSGVMRAFSARKDGVEPRNGWFYVLFSEYIEGSSNNKAVELYNSSNDPADMGAENCFVEIFANGANNVTSRVSLDGVIIQPGDTFVICNNQIDDSVGDRCDVFTGSLSFNGDDRVQIGCNGSAIDIIGQVGVDPGQQWGVGNQGTRDATMRRNCDVEEGYKVALGPFDPTIEWTHFPRDTFDGLGTHCVADCAGVAGGNAAVDCAGECNGNAVEDCAGRVMAAR